MEGLYCCSGSTWYDPLGLGQWVPAEDTVIQCVNDLAASLQQPHCGRKRPAARDFTQDILYPIGEIVPGSTFVRQFDVVASLGGGWCQIHPSVVNKDIPATKGDVSDTHYFVERSTGPFEVQVWGTPVGHGCLVPFSLQVLFGKYQVLDFFEIL